MESGEAESRFKENLFYIEDNLAVEQVVQRGCEQPHLVLQLTLLLVEWETS